MSPRGPPHITDDDFDEDDDVDTVSSKISEEKLIKQKSEFKQEFIHKFRSLFSETLNQVPFV